VVLLIKTQQSKQTYEACNSKLAKHDCICSRLDIRLLDSHSTETQANNESLENANAIKIDSKDPTI